MFVLLTLSFLVVSIVLIRFLCHRTGIQVKTTALVLAAFLAACMVALAIALGTYLDTEQYIRLVVLALVASLLVTAVNEYLLKREKKPKEWETAALPWEDLETIELDPLPRPAAKGEGAPPEAAESAADTGAPAMEAAAEPTATPLGSAEDSAAPVPGGAAELLSEAGREVEERTPAESAEAEAALEEGAKAPEAPAPPTLDELLDIAYANRDSDIPAAIAAYREAIDRYPEDDYAPFLVIELAGLYKDSAYYSGAIDLYKKALDLPIVAQNDALVDEFKKSIRYLGIVSDILAKHHAEGTPYPAIPEPIRQEIETAFGIG